MMLRLLFKQTRVANDPTLIFDMRGAIKTAIKYGGENPGRAAAIAGVIGATGLFNYYERLKKQEMEEMLAKAERLYQSEIKQLDIAEEIARQASLHFHPEVRARAAGLFVKIRDHHRDHNVAVPMSDLLPDTLDSLARRAQLASELHMEGLDVEKTICKTHNPLFQLGDTTKAIEYASPQSPLESHMEVMQVCGRLWNSALSCLSHFLN